MNRVNKISPKQLPLPNFLSVPPKTRFQELHNIFADKTYRKHLKDFIESLEDNQVLEIASILGLKKQNDLLEPGSFDRKTLQREIINKLPEFLFKNPELFQLYNFPYKVLTNGSPSKISEKLQEIEIGKDTTQLPEFLQNYFSSIGIAKHKMVAYIFYLMFNYRSSFSSSTAFIAPSLDLGEATSGIAISSQMENGLEDLYIPNNPLQYLNNKYGKIKKMKKEISFEEIEEINTLTELLFEMLIEPLRNLVFEIEDTSDSYIKDRNQLIFLVQKFYEIFIYQIIESFTKNNIHIDNIKSEDFLIQLRDRVANKYFVDQTSKYFKNIIKFAYNCVVHGIIEHNQGIYKVDPNQILLEEKVNYTIHFPADHVSNYYLSKYLREDLYNILLTGIRVSTRIDFQIPTNDGKILIIDFKNSLVTSEFQPSSRGLENLLYALAVHAKQTGATYLNDLGVNIGTPIQLNLGWEERDQYNNGCIEVDNPDLEKYIFALFPFSGEVFNPISGKNNESIMITNEPYFDATSVTQLSEYFLYVKKMYEKIPLQENKN